MARQSPENGYYLQQEAKVASTCELKCGPPPVKYVGFLYCRKIGLFLN